MKVTDGDTPPSRFSVKVRDATLMVIYASRFSVKVRDAALMVIYDGKGIRHAAEHCHVPVAQLRAYLTSRPMPALCSELEMHSIDAATRLRIRPGCYYMQDDYYGGSCR